MEIEIEMKGERQYYNMYPSIPITGSVFQDSSQAAILIQIRNIFYVFNFLIYIYR